MYWPFVVLALPRSRTGWMQHWLGGAARCGHDLAIGPERPRDWFDRLWHGLAGTVETGAQDLWPLIRVAMPGARIAVVHRPVGDVIQSLRQLGLQGQLLELEIERRAEVLEAVTNAVHVRYVDLNDASACAWLFEHLTGLRFDFDWWQVASGTNVQVDVQGSLERQQSCAAGMQQLAQHTAADCAKLAGNAPPRYTRIGREPWASFWSDAQHRVAHDHLATHDGQFPGRPFEIDEGWFTAMDAAGRLLITTARTNGTLTGYMIWTLGTAPQSRGTLVADQGPTFVPPGAWGVAKRLLDWSLATLPKLGYRNVTLHHATQGRGASLGRHLLRLGARPLHHTYTMELH